MLNHIWLSFSGANIVFGNVWFVAAIWMALALVASLVSIRIGISVALIEIFIGVIAGNFLHLTASNEWINFLALLGSGVLTFLAGAEIDPCSLKANLRASVLIGVLSFAVPFGVIWLFAQFVLGWPLHQAQIAGIALSTTSVAVVYAVMIEGGFSDTAMGKMILAACFITDFGTVLALGGLFANYNLWLLVFVVTMTVALFFMPTWTRGIINKFGATRVSEPEIKFVLFVLFILGGLAALAQSEAVLPAYLIGLVLAGLFLHNKVLMHWMRAIAFSVLTPFYFLKAGSFVSFKALLAGVFIIGALFFAKMATKIAGVLPCALGFDFGRRNAAYTTLLMATGLTFGTISALFGFQNHIIDQRQYTILVTVVILSAFVPTLLAQKFFQPTKDAMRAWGRRYSYGLGVLSVEDAETETNNSID